MKAARHAFEEGAWSKLTAVERGRLMTKLGEAILAHHEELSQLEARDCGKPMKQARADITAAARYFEFYGAAADKVHGDTIPFLDGYMVTILREAKGRDRPHHSLELSGADVRPQSRRRHWRWATPWS